MEPLRAEYRSSPMPNFGTGRKCQWCFCGIRSENKSNYCTAHDTKEGREKAAHMKNRFKK